MPIARRWWSLLMATTLALAGCPSDDDDTVGDDDTGDDDSADDDDTPPPMPISFVAAISAADAYALVDPETSTEWVNVQGTIPRIDDVSLAFPGHKVLLVGPTGPGDEGADVAICDAFSGADLLPIITFDEAPGATAVDGSPVNEDVVFSAWAVDETSGELRESIFVTDHTGAEVTQLTTAGEVLVLPGSGVTVVSTGETMPNWAPTGGHITYVAHTVREYPPETEYEVVVVMDEEGASKSVIYASEAGADIRAPCFTSDSDFVVVCDRDADGNRRVRTVWAEVKTYSDVTDSLDLPDDPPLGDLACANASTRIAYTLGEGTDGPLYTALLQFTGTALLVNGEPEQLSPDDATHGYGAPDWARRAP